MKKINFKLKRGKAIGVAVSLFVMSTVVFGSLKLNNTAFADKDSSTKPSIETNVDTNKGVFSFNEKGEIILNTNASIKEIVDELVRIKIDSNLNLDLDELLKDTEDLMAKESITPSELSDRLEDILDEVEDIVEDIEDEIEDLKESNTNENISYKAKEKFIKAKEKLRSEYIEERKELRQELKEEIKEGKDPKKAKEEFNKEIKELKAEYIEEIKELKVKYLGKSNTEEKINNKNDKKQRYSYDDDDDKDDDDDEDDEDDEEDDD